MAIMPACCSGLDPGIEKGLYGKTAEIEKICRLVNIIDSLEIFLVPIIVL